MAKLTFTITGVPHVKNLNEPTDQNGGSLNSGQVKVFDIGPWQAGNTNTEEISLAATGVTATNATVDSYSFFVGGVDRGTEIALAPGEATFLKTTVTAETLEPGTEDTTGEVDAQVVWS